MSGRGCGMLPATEGGAPDGGASLGTTLPLGAADGMTSEPDGRTIVDAGVGCGVGLAFEVGGSVGWTGGAPQGTDGSGQSDSFGPGCRATTTAVPSARPMTSTTTKTRISRTGETRPPRGE